ncbi:MAG: hypothetical protein II547_06755, partial [Treponema sp.]|nr:hypothetical protein [Treponema sp.]
GRFVPSGAAAGSAGRGPEEKPVPGGQQKAADANLSNEKPGRISASDFGTVSFQLIIILVDLIVDK